jgi:hypothetical protein
MFFFEKKNQKTFVPWRTPPDKLSPISKSFLLLFFKKEALAFALLSSPDCPVARQSRISQALHAGYGAGYEPQYSSQWRTARA